MQKVGARVLEMLSPQHPAKVVAVCGPTGVGKTTLMISISRTILDGSPTGPEFMPVIQMLCPASGQKGYDFGRMHWTVLLDAMENPLTSFHWDPDDAARSRREGRERSPARRKSSGDDQQLAAEKYLKHRKTRVLMLDEAQHMVRVRGRTTVAENMDLVKRFGDASGVKQVLFGTEEMIEMFRCNAQLTQRTEEIFFDAYNAGSEADIESFETILRQLFLALPVRNPQELDLEKHFEEIFLRSVGCVGILKTWLVQALNRALNRNKETVSYSDLEQTALGNSRLLVIGEGIRKFRGFMHELPTDDEVRKTLGMPTDSQPKARRRRRERAGTRKAHRDPVQLLSVTGA